MDEYDEDELENEEGELEYQTLRADIKAQIEARRHARFGPPITVEIVQELYTKAKDHQDQLTQEERQLLLSRGDLIGKALAEPSSLTDAERNDVIGRPDPKTVRFNVERATNGRLSTAAELIAQARENPSSLSKEESDLVAYNFNETLSMSMNNNNHAPGAKEARILLIPAGDQSVINAAFQRMLMGPETNWEAYMATQQAAEEQRLRVLATRREEYERYTNALRNHGAEARHQIITESEDVGQNTRVPPYNPVRRTFGPPPEQVSQHRQPVQGSSISPEVQHSLVAPQPSVPVPGLNTGRIYLPAAFMVYVNEQRDRFREENPDLTLGQIGMLMGDHWEAMGVEEKAPYEAKAEQTED